MYFFAWRAIRRPHNLSKDTLTHDQLTASVTTRSHMAAQPCSYIYPIYAVVKNRHRDRIPRRYALSSALELMPKAQPRG